MLDLLTIMLPVIVLTIVFIGFVYLLLKPYFLSSTVPSPPALPILRHTLYFVGDIDHLDLSRKLCDRFKDQQLYEMESFSKYPSTWYPSIAEIPI